MSHKIPGRVDLVRLSTISSHCGAKVQELMLTLCDIRIRRFRERFSADCRQSGLGSVFWVKQVVPYWVFGRFELPRASNIRAGRTRKDIEYWCKELPCWHSHLIPTIEGWQLHMPHCP